MRILFGLILVVLGIIFVHDGSAFFIHNIPQNVGLICIFLGVMLARI